jgi:endonuclease-3 related protein
MQEGASRKTLLAVYQRMLRRYGPQHWWPGDTRFEIMVGAVLTQAAAWVNVRKAITNLIDAGALSPQAIRGLPEEELAQLIYPSGYYNAKARKLKALAEYLGQRFDDDLEAMSRENPEALRAELLSVYGIGEETADDILLYAVGAPSVVIDNYTRRTFSRLGLASEKGTYSAYRSLFLGNLPPDRELLAEYHALIVRHGKEMCRKIPLCEGCCLLDVCPTGQSRTGGHSFGDGKRDTDV